jgi:DNA polymerase sigma
MLEALAPSSYLDLLSNIHAVGMSSLHLCTSWNGEVIAMKESGFIIRFLKKKRKILSCFSGNMHLCNNLWASICVLVGTQNTRSYHVLA